MTEKQEDIIYVVLWFDFEWFAFESKSQGQGNLESIFGVVTASRSKADAKFIVQLLVNNTRGNRVFRIDTVIVRPDLV